MISGYKKGGLKKCHDMTDVVSTSIIKMVNTTDLCLTSFDSGCHNAENHWVRVESSMTTMRISMECKVCGCAKYTASAIQVSTSLSREEKKTGAPCANEALVTKCPLA